MRLSDLKMNQKGTVLKVDVPNDIVKRHLMEMGVTKGTKIKVVNVAPMGDPISIELRGYELAIRKSEANFIFVEVTL